VRLKKLEDQIQPFKNEEGFEQIAKALGIPRPQKIRGERRSKRPPKDKNYARRASFHCGSQLEHAALCYQTVADRRSQVGGPAESRSPVTPPASLHP
jgi:hypothetical protein